MPRPKITDKSTPSGFVRSMPNASPAEIMAAAKKAGIKFGASLVYMVRRNDAKAGKPVARGKPVQAKSSAKSTSGTTAPPKKAAVLAIGLDKPTGDIIEAAKAKGVTVSRTYIQLLRQGRPSGRKEKRAKAAHARTSTAARAKTTAGARAGTPQSKSELIRSMLNAPAKAIVEAGKKAGLKLNEKYVATVRYNDRQRGKKKGSTLASQPSVSRDGRNETRRTAPVASEEAMLRRLIVNLGITEARAIFADVEKKLAAIAG